ncbi:MAG: dethiobiotin synthase [Pseudomonadota bacterium]
MMESFFIAGTDTGVGKTIFCLLLMHYFGEKGYRPFYLKPFQTGCSDPYDTYSDARFIYSHIRRLREKDPADSMIFCFQNPKAPWFAGRDMNRQVDLASVSRIMNEKASRFNPIIVEGAGGLLVPLTENLLVADAVGRLNLKVILVARGSLGTINHTLLSIEAIMKRGIDLAGIVFMDAGESQTPEDLIRENMEAIKHFSGIPVAGVIRHIRDFSDPGVDYFSVLDKLFNDY